MYLADWYIIKYIVRMNIIDNMEEIVRNCQKFANLRFGRIKLKYNI